MSALDTGIIIAYLVMMVAIGFYANRKQGSVEDYFVGNGRVGTISIACLWLAGWVGRATTKTYSAKPHATNAAGHARYFVNLR